MKFWIQDKLSKLENYFYVEKELKQKIDIWSAIYCGFVSVYILLWVEHYNINQTVTISFLIFISFISFFTSSLYTRFKLVILIILVNPLFNSLMHSVSDKSLKISLILLVLASVCFLKIKRLTEIGKLLIIINVVFCMFLIGSYYSSRFEFNYDSNPPISKIISDKDADKDIYVIILDGFSSKEVLKKYFNLESELLKYLNKNGFEEKESLSKYTPTDQSLPNIFSGSVFKEAGSYKAKDIYLMEQLLPGKYLKTYAARHGHDITFNSFLLDRDGEKLKELFGRGADFRIYTYPIIDRILFKSLDEVDTNTATNRINTENLKYLQEDIKTEKKNLNIYHFLTFHNWSSEASFSERFEKSLNHSDEIGISVIKLILEKNKNAKIVVLSDHAERESVISKKDRYQGILYIKN